ncbi:MAG: ring-cleaving dioxygenase [Chloroflexi bacterium]|nr:ring-cleaving dioxygenase [Chloroflexota bacterium]MBP8055874.1 ring-cleaving dioxygenase [Chloroflexota bacterium]
MQPIPGIHHITVLAKNPQANVDFYQRVLGQRLVKTTVNFDDPGTYHLYYGDEVGSPGTILTFFPWPTVARGIPGQGEVGAVAYTIAPDSLAYWQERLAAHGVVVKVDKNRFGAAALSFADPDGLRVELITLTDPAPIHHWAEGPIPAAHTLRGFHSATLWVRETQATANLLTHLLGYVLVGQEGSRWRYQTEAGEVGGMIDLVARPELPRGRMGAGSVHHIAFRTANDGTQREYQLALTETGLRVTPVQDRQYFHSIYFREPNGVLFEIATDPPGFTADETIPELGSRLKLPPWLEPQRQEIEQLLPPLQRVMNDE